MLAELLIDDHFKVIHAVMWIWKKTKKISKVSKFHRQNIEYIGYKSHRAYD